MSERPFPAVAVLAFVAGLAVGSAATLFTTRNSSSAANPAIGVANAALTTDASQAGGTGSGTTMNAAQAKGTGVFVNERELTREQTAALVQMYGAAPPPGPQAVR